MPKRKREATSTPPLIQLLLGMKKVVRLIDENPARDLRRVMLGLLLQDLETARAASTARCPLS
jgi:hypothetical protein